VIGKNIPMYCMWVSFPSDETFTYFRRLLLRSPSNYPVVNCNLRNESSGCGRNSNWQAASDIPYTTGRTSQN
jgi:hypothetical protein